MKKFKENKGITLIALVITIIILLILAGISIAMLTGQNGLLTKASKADKETDIVDTKEQIKLEIMGNFDEKSANYINQDVVNAVEKITGKKVAENTSTIESKKGNEVDISDLWVKEMISFKISIPDKFICNGSYTVDKGTTWNDFISKKNWWHTVENNEGISETTFTQKSEEDDRIFVNWWTSGTLGFCGYQFIDPSGKQINGSDEIKERNLYI